MRQPLMRTCVAVFALTLLAHTAADAQRTTTLVIDVADASTGAPLADAEVWIPDAKRVVHTNWIGEARVDVSRGLHRVSIRKLGYAPSDVQLKLIGDTLGPVFKLEPLPTSLDKMRVIAAATPSALRDFERRRRMAIGHFLTAQDLDRNQTLEFGFLAQTHFPGVRVVYDDYGKPHLSQGNSSCSSRTSTANAGRSCFIGTTCPIGVLLDGIPLGDDALDFLFPWDLAGVEYYSGTEVPPEYKFSGSGCGLLLAWSRPY